MTQHKDNLEQYLRTMLDEVYPNKTKTSKLSLEKSKENGQSFFVGNIKYDINTNEVTIEINQKLQ